MLIGGCSIYPVGLCGREVQLRNQKLASVNMLLTWGQRTLIEISNGKRATGLGQTGCEGTRISRSFWAPVRVTATARADTGARGLWFVSAVLVSELPA